MDFLHANTRNLLGGSLWDEEPLTISARGKNVIVIGGGDTGTDCVATSLRHGCRKLAQFEILGQPPLERQANNPWPEWPKVYKLDYGQEEAKAVYGHDPRSYEILTKRFIGDEEGQVKEVHTVNVSWVLGDHGRMIPQEIPGTEKIWSAQLVLLAMGFLGPENQLLEKLNVSRDARSNVATPQGSYATNVPGVFSAGDMRRGQSLVVWAIQEGRAAAAQVDQYLTSI
jgi:glutamate synthase (NADPH/NADH) small chain